MQSRPAPKDEPAEAYAAALRLLARREHSGVELRRKLHQRGFTEASIGPSLEQLCAAGYLSDARFAGSLVRHRAAQGYGDLRLRAELAQHGIDHAIVEQALEALDADWCERALAQARRHFGEPPATAGARARVLRHLAQRGFASSVARAALAEWCKSEQ
ncbi:regulatory protein RecX [Thioalkalivibrio sp.]|uniref:regulatory protein RecX n=1 Tax=Thioalkalivibrio sp. TaxID=2093813 RepID=UPI003976DFA1